MSWSVLGNHLGNQSYTNMSNYSWHYISITHVLKAMHAVNSYDYELQLVQYIKKLNVLAKFW